MIGKFAGIAPKIAPGCYIHESAVVIGKVEMGDDCSIWPCVVIRADTAWIRIGRNTNIQDGTVIHADDGDDITIGDNVAIGHKAVIHCSAIGENTLIGMGAILLPGTKIGKNCIIGAGALVLGHQDIPDNSVVLGMPAQVVREVTEKDLALTGHAVTHYKELVKDHDR
jgi:carbonic anhydrase/acetyltransferase-like protein (isoleucine patch superfamily)